MGDAARDFGQLQPRFVDAIQRRYELIRPLVLFNEGTPAERAQATHTQPETVRTLLQQFQTQGMLGLGGPETDVGPHDQPHRVSEAVRQEMATDETRAADKEDFAGSRPLNTASSR